MNPYPDTVEPYVSPGFGQLNTSINPDPYAPQPAASGSVGSDPKAALKQAIMSGMCGNPAAAKGGPGGVANTGQAQPQQGSSGAGGAAMGAASKGMCG